MKRYVKKLLLKSGVFKVVGQLLRPGVAILRYHSVQENPDDYSNSIGLGIIHSESVFKEQMEIVARCFKPVTLDDILLYLRGEKGIPRKAVAVTFDDGFADNFEIVSPLLDKFGIRAAFFITVKSIEAENPPWFCRLRYAFGNTKKTEWSDSEKGKVWNIISSEDRNVAFLYACKRFAHLTGHLQENEVSKIEINLEIETFSTKNGIMMNWEQIKKLMQNEHIIGSHTLSHPNIAYVSNDQLNWELVESKKVLEEKLGRQIIHFSYPSPILQPHWTEKTIMATKESGYQTAVTCTPGLVNNDTNPLSLNRIWVPSKKDHFLWDLESTLLGRQT